MAFVDFNLLGINITGSLGISPEREAEITEQEKKMLQEFLQSEGAQLKGDLLLEKFCQIPQTPGEAVWIGMLYQRVVEALTTVFPVEEM